jgi:outer membrane protein TolC
MNRFLSAALALAVASLPFVPRPGTAAPAEVRELTLERAIAMALTRDERPRIASQQLASSEAQVDRARAFFFPDLSLQGGYSFRGDPGMFQDRHLYTGSAAATLTLFDGRGFPLLRAAKLARSAAELDRAETRRQVAFEAAGAYLTTLGLQAVVEAAQNRVAFAREQLADARGRASAQLASSNDVSRATLELSTAELALRRARGDLASGMLNLGWLLGAELRGPLRSPDALLAEAARAPVARDGAIGQAQARRLDVRSGRLRVGAARERAKEPLWRWVPALSAIGQADASSSENMTGPDAANGQTIDWFVGLSAVWTLWDGGERSADRDDLVAQAEVAELESARQTRGVALEVRNALVALDTSRGTVDAASSAVTAARKNVEEARALYRQGLARALDVADATAGLFEAEVALAQERYGLGVALLNLRSALGHEPLQRARPRGGAR